MAKWRVRGGEAWGAGGRERRGRTEVQAGAEVWGAAAAQTVRWSARTCMFVLCHSLHISLLINHIPSQPDLQLSVCRFIQLLKYVRNCFCTLAEEMCTDQAGVGVRGGCDITPAFPKVLPDPELQNRERFPASSSPDRHVHHYLAGWELCKLRN